jgi:hypothetical protein
MTRTEYVDSVYQIIKNNERGGAGIAAAALGVWAAEAADV